MANFKKKNNLSVKPFQIYFLDIQNWFLQKTGQNKKKKCIF